MGLVGEDGAGPGRRRVQVGGAGHHHHPRPEPELVGHRRPDRAEHPQGGDQGRQLPPGDTRGPTSTGS